MKQLSFSKRITFPVLTALLGLCLFSSCESVLFIELEESDKLVVMNGAVGQDSTVRVQISRTRHILDNADLPPLENAMAELFRGEESLGKLVYRGEGYYELPAYRPGVGEDFRLEVESPGLPPVSAPFRIPEGVEINDLDTMMIQQEFDEYGWSYTERFFVIDVSFRDPAGEENFYLLDLRVDRSYTSWRDTTYKVVDSLWYDNRWNYFLEEVTETLTDTLRMQDNPGISSGDLLVEANTSKGVLFSDQLIDGKNYSFRAQTMIHGLRSADSAVVDVRLHSISKDYYRYLKTRQEHYETRDDPFAVPVIVYSNVDGGAGFLGGFSSDVRTITTFVPEFEDYYYYDYY